VWQIDTACGTRRSHLCCCYLQTLGLEHFELLLEKALDTRVLLAWGPESVVLSFCGTSSWTNLKADLSAWLTGGDMLSEPVSCRAARGCALTCMCMAYVVDDQTYASCTLGKTLDRCHTSCSI
jgi:hypothetical protein